MTNTQVTEAMADLAIAWFARLRADNVSAKDRMEFVNWLRADRKHQIAFVEIMNLWDDMAVVKTLDFAELREFDAVWEQARQSGITRKEAEVSYIPVYSLGSLPV